MTATPTPENQTPKHTNPIKHKKLIIAVSVIMVFIITLVSAFFIMVKVGEIRLKNSLVAGEKLEATEDNIDENAIYHNNKAYYYNENLINLLLIGVDAEKNNKGSQGQADALYLVSVDTKNSNVKIFSISRNTLCEIDILDIDGNSFSTEERQICLAYSYGKDDANSSQNCVKALSRFLYNIPINGYYTIHQDSISDIVNSVGGVKVTITENEKDSLFSEQIGQTITLRGNDALSYLQTRGDSNGPRVERHTKFIKSFINSAKTAIKKDLSLPFKIANKLSRKAVTDIDISSAVYLATEAIDWKIDFISVNGEYSIKDNLEILTVDDKDLKELVLGNFYIAK